MIIIVIKTKLPVMSGSSHDKSTTLRQGEKVYPKMYPKSLENMGIKVYIEGDSGPANVSNFSKLLKL